MLKIGDLLKDTRKSKGIPLSRASEATKIPQKMLRALEQERYEVFASEVFLKGFLKNYAKYLGIDTQKALAIYRRDRRDNAVNEPILDESVKLLEEPKAIITPGRLVFGVTALIVLAIIIFIIFQLNKIIQPPYLEINDPVAAQAPGEVFTEVNTDVIRVAGKVEVGSKLLINGNEVTTNNLQEFNVENFKLNPGSNEIHIVAQSYYFSKSSEIKLIVLCKKEKTNQEENSNNDDSSQQNNQGTEEVKKMTIDLEVGPEDAWIVAVVDQVTKVSQVVPVGTTYSFEASESFSISTPRPQMVTLTINGEVYTLNAQAPSEFKLVNGAVIQQ